MFSLEDLSAKKSWCENTLKSISQRGVLFVAAGDYTLEVRPLACQGVGEGTVRRMGIGLSCC